MGGALIPGGWGGRGAPTGGVGGTTGGVGGLGAAGGGAPGPVIGCVSIFLSKRESNTPDIPPIGIAGFGAPIGVAGGVNPGGFGAVGTGGGAIPPGVIGLGGMVPGAAAGAVVGIFFSSRESKKPVEDGLGAAGTPGAGGAVGLGGIIPPGIPGVAPGAGIPIGFTGAAPTGGTFPKMRESRTPEPVGETGLTPGADAPGKPDPGMGPVGLGIPKLMGLGPPSGEVAPDGVIPGLGALVVGMGELLGIPKLIPAGFTATVGVEVVAGAAGISGEGGTSPGFFIFVGNVRMSRVPGSPFSATAPPPWAPRMVFTKANFNPVPANWAEAVCLGS
jgi:hypothetical protein